MNEKALRELCALTELFTKKAMSLVDTAATLVDKRASDATQTKTASANIVNTLDNVVEDGERVLSNPTLRNNIITKLASHQGALEVCQAVACMLKAAQDANDAQAAKIANSQLGSGIKSASHGDESLDDYWHNRCAEAKNKFF